MQDRPVVPKVTFGAARFGGCPSDLARLSIRLRGRDLRCSVVARQVGPEAAPLTFLARAPEDRRANESEEEFFLTSPMKSVDGLTVVEASRVRGAEQYRDMVRDLYDAVSHFMRAEKPSFVWGATTVSTRFGFPDRKPVEALFRGTSWSSAWMLWVLADRVGRQGVLRPVDDPLTTTTAAVDRLARAVPQAQELLRATEQYVAALGVAVPALADAVELEQATEHLRAAAKTAHQQERARRRGPAARP